MTNYFKLFGIPESCQVDDTALLQKYLQLQKQHHPDSPTATNGSSSSAEINKALRILQNPLSRTEHYLEVKEVDVDDITLPSHEMVAFLEIEESVAFGAMSIDTAMANAKDKLTNLMKQIHQAEKENDIDSISAKYATAQYTTRLMERLSTKKQTS